MCGCEAKFVSPSPTLPHAMYKGTGLLRGVYTAIVTPFSEDGKTVDWESYERLVRHQIAGGVAGIVACGTTGESPTLSTEEKRKAISEAVRLARGSGVIVIAGTGSNDTASTVEDTAWARDAGADMALVVNPYYNRPTQPGLLAHFRAVLTGAPGIPILLYNIPGRTGVALTADTLEALSKEAGIVGVKDATGTMDYACEVGVRCGSSLTVLSGDDSLTLPFMSLGATGVVSVVSNLYPAPLVKLVKQALEGDFAGALKAHNALFPFFKGAFIESNPGPIKVALAAAGIIKHATLRLPLAPLEPSSAVKLEAILKTTADNLKAL